MVCYRHYDADGDEEDGPDTEGEEETVPGEVDGVAGLSDEVGYEWGGDLLFDDENPYCGHTEACDDVPENRNIVVSPHQTVVDIF